MKTKIMSIFTRTPLHVGCGSSVGAVDQPVVRERHTGYPLIPGSSIKGVLADLWLEKDADGTIKFKVNEKGVKESIRNEDGIKLLGSTNNKEAKAGSLLVGEGRLLAFPVRSAKNCWAWITCPLVLDRFARDTGARFDRIKDEETLASSELKVSDSVIFEEYPLTVAGKAPDDVVAALKAVCGDSVWQDNLDKHLAFVSDDLFAYFVKNACEIANHNRINDETGVVDGTALFAQENVPSETLFYSVFNSESAEDFEKVKTELSKNGNALQIGADKTTGLGWCTVGFKK